MTNKSPEHNEDIKFWPGCLITLAGLSALMVAFTGGFWTGSQFRQISDEFELGDLLGVVSMYHNDWVDTGDWPDGRDVVWSDQRLVATTKSDDVRLD